MARARSASHRMRRFAWGSYSRCCPVCTWTARHAKPRAMVKINRLLTWPTVLLFLALCAMASTALAAADPPAPDTDASAWVKALYDAVTSKAWTPAVGLVLIGLVYVARRWALGWVSWFKTPFGGLVLAFVMSLAGTLGVAFAAGAKPTLSMVATSLTTAAAAAGVWEWLKAHIPGVQQAAVKAVAVDANPYRDPGAM